MLLLNSTVLCTRHLTRPEYGYLFPSAYRAKSVKQLWDVDNNIFFFLLQISNQIPSLYCSTDVYCYNSLTFFNTLTILLGWKSAFAIMCSIAFGGGGLSTWILVHAYSIYKVCKVVCKGKIQTLQFIRNFGQHTCILISVIIHFILSYTTADTVLKKIILKLILYQFLNSIHVWTIFFFVTSVRNRVDFLKVQQFAT